MLSPENASKILGEVLNRNNRKYQIEPPEVTSWPILYSSWFQWRGGLTGVSELDAVTGLERKVRRLSECLF